MIENDISPKTRGELIDILTKICERVETTAQHYICYITLTPCSAKAKFTFSKDSFANDLASSILSVQPMTPANGQIFKISNTDNPSDTNGEDDG